MSRYIIAKRRTSKQSPESDAKILTLINDFCRPAATRTIRSNQKFINGILSFESEDAFQIEKIEKSEVSSQYWIEPVIFHNTQGNVRKEFEYSLRAVCKGRPVVGALLTYEPSVFKGRRIAPINHSDSNILGITDDAGYVKFNVDNPQFVKMLKFSPRSENWSVPVNWPLKVSEVECPPILLPETGLDWRHSIMGIKHANPRFGEGIRIGVIDTGIGKHECLDHVKDMGKINSNFRITSYGYDDNGHGTHVCGIIGSRLNGSRGILGIAPGAEIVSVRVSDKNGSANQADIASAIKYLSCSGKETCNIINISFAAKEESRVLYDAIEDAAEKGCICICAAGNTCGDTLWPAQLKNVIAVSAIGYKHSCPVDAIDRKYHSRKSGKNNIIMASFSCRNKVDCCGPGVGIVSTAPQKVSGKRNSWRVMSGTSMAAPAVSGALAVALSSSTSYNSMANDRERHNKARMLLRQICRPVGLGRSLEGDGLPTVNQR